jgi:small subunit ribosomal protein S1
MVRRHDEEVHLKDDAGEESDVEVKPRRRKPTTRLIHEDGAEEAGGAAVGVKELDADEDASSMAQWLQLYEDSLKDLEEGEIVRGRVLKIDDKEVTVDVGFKSDGVIPVEEFPDLEGVKVGDEIEVFLEKTENQDGLSSFPSSVPTSSRSGTASRPRPTTASWSKAS